MLTASANRLSHWYFLRASCRHWSIISLGFRFTAASERRRRSIMRLVSARCWATNETGEMSAARATVDPYHDYLKALYERIIYYLNQTVFSLIALKGKAASDAVEAPAQVLPMAFFDMAGIGGSAAGNTSFANFNEAFDSYHGRVLLLGEPGAGKTTALMAFARDATWRRLEIRRCHCRSSRQSPPGIPIYILPWSIGWRRSSRR